jgi:hypothetical protein
MLHHFPEADDTGFSAPVEKAFAGELLHPGPASPGKFDFWVQTTERSHEGGAMVIAARFARYQIESHGCAADGLEESDRPIRNWESAAK